MWVFAPLHKNSAVEVDKPPIVCDRRDAPNEHADSMVVSYCHRILIIIIWIKVMNIEWIKVVIKICIEVGGCVYCMYNSAILGLQVMACIKKWLQVYKWSARQVSMCGHLPCTQKFTSSSI